MSAPNPYSVHPGVAMVRTWIETLPQKTGRSLADWLRLIEDEGPATGRLIDTGGFAKKDRITHRIPITSLADLDDEVRRWLKAAYDLDA